MGSLPTCSNGPAGSGLAEMDLRVLAPAVGSHGSLGRQGFAVAHNEVHPGRGGDVVGKIGGVATVFAHPFILSTPAEAVGLCSSYSRFRTEAGWDQPGCWRSTQRTTSTIPAIVKPAPSASRRPFHSACSKARPPKYPRKAA